MNRSRWYSIRTKLLLIMILSGLPLVLAVCTLLYSKYKTDYRDAEHDAIVTARAIAYNHTAQVEGFRNLFITLAQLPEVKERDRDACGRILQKVLRQSPTCSNIGIADGKGNLVASGVNPLPQPFGVGDRKYFQEAIRNKGFSVGEYTISRAVGKPALHFALPVLDWRGEPQAVVYAAHDLSQFNSFFDRQAFPRHSTLTLTDHRGIILHTYPEGTGQVVGAPDRPGLFRRMQGAQDEGTFVGAGIDGARRVFAFKKIRLQKDHSPYMYIRISIPEELVMESVNRFIITALAVTFIAVGTTIILSRLLAARYLMRPLEHLSAAALAVAEGNLAVRTALPCHDELGVLSASFDAMTASLAVRQQEKDAAEARLMASEEKFRAIFNHLTDAIFIHEIGTGRILDVNDAMTEMYGYSTAEAKNLTIGDLCSERAPCTAAAAMQFLQLAADGEPQLFEWQTRHRNGSFFWVEISMRRSSIGPTDAIVVAARDISERKAAETEKKALMEQLTQSQKMESVGRLAGGIAHDFNNLLTPIIGFAELAAGELPEHDGARAKIEHIVQAGMRAKDLVHQLLSFSRKQVLEMKVLDLNEIISSFYQILRRTISERIEIRLDLAPALGGIRADRTKIEQVLMNLLVNAQDAIVGSGRVTIETAEVILDDEYTRFHADAQPGRYALLAVSDTGGGIAKEDIPHVFEPFFTTKGTGKGSGLGLATVYGIVKQHQGCIWVYSEVGQGTVFKMYLPMAQAIPYAGAEQLVRQGEVREVQGTVLLVEDNDLVRAMLKELLLSTGYEVVDAGHPREAVNLAQGRQIDLLVSDVVMPDMDGPALHRTLLVSHPGLTVLFMSGYTSNVVVQVVEEADLVNFIQKPFAIKDMTERVAAMMAGRRAPR